MPKFLLKRWHGLHIVWTFILLALMVIVISAYQWILGAIFFVLCGVIAFYTLKAETAFRRDLNAYIATISHRVKKAGNEVMNGLPIGIILYNEEKKIEWHNPFVSKMLEQESVIGESIVELFADF